MNLRRTQCAVLLCSMWLLNVNFSICQTQDDNALLDEEELEDFDHLIEQQHLEQQQSNIEATKNRFAAQLIALLDHYKQEDPVGMPGASIPDPMDVPDIRKSMGMATLHMQQVKAHGLSRFRITSIKADLQAMKVDGTVQLDELFLKGQYTLDSLFSRANGPFTLQLKNVVVQSSATLSVQRDGQLLTEAIDMDITFSNMNMDFQNMGFLGSIFQGVVNSAPNLVFDSMKPFIVQEADRKLRAQINTNIEKLLGDRRLPNSITPLDMAIAEGRKKVRGMGYDPYHVPDYNRSMGVLSAQMSNTWIKGISSFYRIGEMVAAMQNNTVQVRIQVGTQTVTGGGQWEIGFGLMSRIGHVQFSIQHIRLSLVLSQPLDTRQRPQINDLQIDMGNIQVRCDGAGTMDYVMELAVNVLPNLLRYQIMDALENPIKVRIQDKLNLIDVEQAIKDHFDKFQSGDTTFNFDFML